MTMNENTDLISSNYQSSNVEELNCNRTENTSEGEEIWQIEFDGYKLGRRKYGVVMKDIS